MSFKDFIIILKEEIKSIELDLELIRDDKYSTIRELKSYNEIIISNEEKYNELQNELNEIKNDKSLSSIKRYTKKQKIKNEMAFIKQLQRFNDRKTNNIGDSKTNIENEILKFSNYKRNFSNLIETIESKMESPDDEELTEEDFKLQLKKLNNQVITLFNDEEIGNKYISKNKNPLSKFINNGYDLKGIQLMGENESN